ncbi:biotin-dependent carboxyltransferase family protein [Paenibacillus caui]|uniref:5-oxoprolinase subunit C family protein n=1 Tax=Paenibacillus caui TaxID=2873927 RepID=UPI0023550131|nr:biotin-dependent carboxyltransferase family protein [Paenibacillus caui]
MSLFVNKPGLLTTVQDLGRFGVQKYGVIAGGAMDTFALRMANLLVGNEETDAGLEITMLGPDILMEQTALISICGGDLSPKLNGKPLPLWRTVLAPKGSRLSFGKLRQGCRAYLAVGGGLDVPVEMNSRTTYLRAGIGGFCGRALRQGDRIPLGAASLRCLNLMGLLAREADGDFGAVSHWSVTPGMLPPYSPNPTVRVIEGEEYGLFSEESLRSFLNEWYDVLPQSDRMGYRFTGSKLTLREKTELISSAVTFGTVQVPSDGYPIVLMADRQTTGGYPKIAQVITADLPLLAQVNLGGHVRFRLISLREAQKQYVARERAIRTLRSGLEQLQK